MMKKIMALLVAVALVGIATPASAGETVNGEYTLASWGFIACSGPPEGDICEENGLAPIGGFRADATTGPHTGVVMTIDDDLAENTYFTICVYTDDHSSCGADPGDVSDSGCGSVSLSHPGITSTNKVSGFVYLANVHGDDNELCLGSSGSFSAVYS